MTVFAPHPNATIDVAAIREAYYLSLGDLARALYCTPLTVKRWEREEGAPTGTYRAVLQAMAAAIPETDDLTRQANGALLVSLGVGGYLQHKAFGPILRGRVR